ncbi:DUF4238 domain-containing protein [Leptospira bouyouniensis]|uniref:DUF4238 domain-containing protein n=1 Tax=Leptospira bouyouniensis TaxID=2484911 RepID=UPI0010912C98|nr:DUF4238 domain-containing protein [Leptospira bouyouniensis]TGM85069.1 DUF4238 domain-containing protein [Leptospira bouyouniensis]
MYYKKKRRHHFVWQYYLNHWSEDGKTIYCLQENKIFKTNTENLANVRDFYKLKKLNQKQIYFLEYMITQMPTFIRPIHKNLLYLFTEIFNIQKKILESNNDAKLLNTIDIMINNLEEEIQRSAERIGLKYLKKLHAKQLDFIENKKDLIEFYYFLSQQYFRTEKLSIAYSTSESTMNSDMSNCWPVLRNIISTNLSWTLHLYKMYIYVVENCSDIDLITSDQPAINLKANYIDPPIRLEIYYPLSPKLALFVCDENKEYNKIDNETALLLNKKMQEISYRQIYSCNRKTIEDLIQ